MAALLPPRWNKRLVDLNVQPLGSGDLEWAELVMISAMVAQRETAQALIARCKAAGRKVVAGGPLFSSEPESFPQVDHLVLGEAELSLPDFLADWQRTAARPRYQAEGFADIHDTPAPLWELAELRHYG
ncbi:MAG: B12-binding domain-containing radical SAM protein, partial [Planctomycetes bacterium]|nr:B12-binding domain-containing radical SAM protein [Planctomycetota bacterium]